MSIRSRRRDEDGLASMLTTIFAIPMCILLTGLMFWAWGLTDVLDKSNYVALQSAKAAAAQTYTNEENNNSDNAYRVLIDCTRAREVAESTLADMAPSIIHGSTAERLVNTDTVKIVGWECGNIELAGNVGTTVKGVNMTVELEYEPQFLAKIFTTLVPTAQDITFTVEAQAVVHDNIQGT